MSSQTPTEKEKTKKNTVPVATDLQDRPVGQVKNVGLHAEAVLRSKGLMTVGDLLAQLPRRYLDLRHAVDWDILKKSQPGSLVALDALIMDSRMIGPVKRRGIALLLRDPKGTATLRAVFFKITPGLKEKVSKGSTVRVIGTLRAGSLGPELVHPKLVQAGSNTQSIEPVYSGIGAIAPGNFTRIMAGALEFADEWADPLPQSLVVRLGLPTSGQALRMIHRPSASISQAELQHLVRGTSIAHRRLGLEELLAMSVALERIRKSSGKSQALSPDPQTIELISKRLNLTLTDGQLRSIDVLLKDIDSDHAMRRLLVAEVGAGKTAVAAAASLSVLRRGGSVAWLAPTTLVAEQHANTLRKALGNDGGPLAVLLGSTPKRSKDNARRAMEAGLVRVVVGTHAVLEERSTPPNLSLAVIDEQHRFGVAQRLALVAGRTPSPHLLVLSATPIPRSLALARYGDLDIITMGGRPEKRQPIVTKVVSPENKEYILHTIARALEAGENKGRAFVVVPRIDADDLSQVAVAEVETWLVSHFGRDNVGVVHGRMNTDEQRETLNAFRTRAVPILLGTSVVEVGLDVPEANLMVVLGAEHFGVAQLHQLRGRVGRAGQKAGCLLVPEKFTDESRERLDEVSSTQDGFWLAEPRYAPSRGRRVVW